MHSFAEEAAAFNPNTTIRLLTQDVSDFENSSFEVVCESAQKPEDIDEALEKVKVSNKSGVFGDHCIISEALAYAVNQSSSSVHNSPPKQLTEQRPVMVHINPKSLQT